MSELSTPIQDRGTARGFWTLFEREVVRVLKIWSQTIAAPVLTGVLYFAVFGVAVGERIGVVDGFAYLTYIVPGVMLMQIATQAYANTSSSVFQAKSDAYIEDVLTAPLHAWQIALAIVLGGVVRSLAIGWLVLLIAVFITDVPLAHPLQAIVLSIAVAVLWASVGVIAGIYAQTFDQHMLIANLVITPLVFVGGVFYSVEMLPSHIELFTRMDPLFYQVNGLRHALLGTSDAPFWLAMLSTIALAAIAFVIQIWLFTTGRRLKT
ncbi:MAG: ABC transporter permease [Gaiellales bacterium]